MSSILTLYGQPNCGPCRAITTKLERSDIEFTYRDVTEDHDARQRLLDLGYSGTPVIETPNGHFGGIDPAKLDAAIEEARTYAIQAPNMAVSGPAVA
ncbi:glutaredoxin family protein [Nesterenkonia sp. K-15-9-6]|uniref:glutaredoxin family protein n=1 Tax=Nesterenkonia sp. K-15-9-6 TaxID=3093918 RepID=UPI0040439690